MKIKNKIVRYKVEQELRKSLMVYNEQGKIKSTLIKIDVMWCSERTVKLKETYKYISNSNKGIYKEYTEYFQYSKNIYIEENVYHMAKKYYELLNGNE